MAQEEEVEEGEVVVEDGMEVIMRVAEVRRMEDGVEEEIFGEVGIVEEEVGIVEEEVEIVEGEVETVEEEETAVEVVETEALLEDTAVKLNPIKPGTFWTF